MEVVHKGIQSIIDTMKEKDFVFQTFNENAKRRLDRQIKEKQWKRKTPHIWTREVEEDVKELNLTLKN